MTTDEDRIAVERVARLMASLDDPAADRVAILRAAGFEQTAAWQYLQQAWLDRLVADPGGELARAFVAAYRAATGCSLREITVTPPPGVRGASGSVDPLDDTAEMTLAPLSTTPAP